MITQEDIVDLLIDNNLIDEGVEIEQLKGGTTTGRVYAVTNNKKPTYVVKQDESTSFQDTIDFFRTYAHSSILPTLYYSNEEHQLIVYDYIAGETHINGGLKREWMKKLIDELYVHYIKVDDYVPWGRKGEIQREHWWEFNADSFKYARMMIGEVLPLSDHEAIATLVEKLKQYSMHERKYYLHGDTGVHNFVFSQNQLQGVIDPSPLIGPKHYDFTYAFCSSPDDLDLETFIPLFHQWNDIGYSEEQLIDELIFQLYTRISICMQHHPNDLPAYLTAWQEWKKRLL